MSTLGSGSCPACGNNNVGLVKQGGQLVLREHKRRGKRHMGPTTCSGSGQKPR